VIAHAGVHPTRERSTSRRRLAPRAIRDMQIDVIAGAVEVVNELSRQVAIVRARWPKAVLEEDDPVLCRVVELALERRRQGVSELEHVLEELGIRRTKTPTHPDGALMLRSGSEIDERICLLQRSESDESHRSAR